MSPESRTFGQEIPTVLWTLLI